MCGTLLVLGRSVGELSSNVPKNGSERDFGIFVEVEETDVGQFAGKTSTNSHRYVYEVPYQCNGALLDVWPMAWPLTASITARGG